MPPKSFTEVIREEDEGIKEAGGPDKPKVALCLSGGGIRSACFCLGVLQGLAQVGWLHRIDYLSTVSGGGYIGSFLSAWILRHPDGVKGVSEELGLPEGVEQPKFIRNLRDNRRYLNHGMGSVSLRIALLFRKLIQNWLLLIPLLLVVSGGPVQVEWASKLDANFVVTGACLFAFMSTLCRLSTIPDRELLSAAFDFLWAVFAVPYCTFTASNYRWLAIYGMGAPTIAAILLSLALNYPQARTGSTLRASSMGLLVETLLWVLASWTINRVPWPVVHGAIALSLILSLKWLGALTFEHFRPGAKKTSSHLLTATLLSVLVTPCALGVTNSPWITRSGLIAVVFALVLSYRACATVNHFVKAGGTRATIDQILLVIASGAAIGFCSSGLFKILAALQLQSVTEFSMAWIFLCLFVFLILRRLAPNWTSFHDEYKKGIVKTFLTLDVPLFELRRRPFHLLNLGLATGDTSKGGSKVVASFTMSALHSGSVATGYRPSKEYQGGSSLGSAAALSGAAISPHLNLPENFLARLTSVLLCLRTGAWFGNPRLAGWEKPLSIHPCLPPLLEAAREATLDREFVYLTDGGHFDNLGLYEMVRRRIETIIVVDAGCDGALEFDDLRNVQRLVGADFGAVIDIETKPIKDGEAHAVMGCIRYEQAGLGGCDGKLIYIKAQLTGDEDPFVRSYKEQHSNFPHESTFYQDYTESQFDSYRLLGRHSVDELIRKANTPEKGGTPVNLNPEVCSGVDGHKPGRSQRETAKILKEGRRHRFGRLGDYLRRV